ncbi:hypothetical protein JZ751_008004 [Albula glossodonta]|uniref:Gamma-synuclein n=1 Tax=Albula glossodonta TaxID=121402 RepID=A0A8T2P4H9_9TELE|nr:hypothetical protein JZ751_008004 [Albula glossodonta]
MARRRACAQASARGCQASCSAHRRSGSHAAEDGLMQGCEMCTKTKEGVVSGVNTVANRTTDQANIVADTAVAGANDLSQKTVEGVENVAASTGMVNPGDFSHGGMEQGGEGGEVRFTGQIQRVLVLLPGMTHSDPSSLCQQESPPPHFSLAPPRLQMLLIFFVI